jgi:hypothetical protein
VIFVSKSSTFMKNRLAIGVMPQGMKFLPEAVNGLGCAAMRSLIVF